MHKQGGLPIPGIEHVDQPYYFDVNTNETPDEFGERLAEELEGRINELGAANVAAFIGEPVQGAGGVVIPPESYWPAVQRVCRKHDLLLIADEVITGFGRLGEWFAFQRMGFEPDLVTFAKGVTSGYIPLGGVLVGERVSSGLMAGGGEFAHGYTYSGHPVACAVALANLDVIEHEGLLAHVRDDIEPYFSELWTALADKHAIVGEARMLGLMGAVELVDAKGLRFDKDLKIGGRCRDLAIENGLVMRAVGDTLIIAPPLVISRQEVDELVDIADRVLTDVTEQLG
jgi:putrescine aminotransferase